MPLTRRETLTASAALPIAGVAATTNTTAASEGQATESYGYIDFRIRPPFRSFRQSSGGPTDLSDDRLMAGFLAEMAEAKIELGVAVGRTTPNKTVLNEDIAALIRHYPGKFAGYGSVDVRDPARAVSEVKHCADLGLRGIAFDNPWSNPPLYNDDKTLMPIYEACAKNNLVIAINASGAIGSDISYTNPVHIQRVALAYPKHPVLVTHGGWPFVNEMIAITLYGLMMQNANIYFQIDYALMADKPLPGASGYIDAINISGLENTPPVYKKAIFGSSFPAIGVKLAVARFNRLNFNHPDARRSVGRDNALDLLNFKSS